MNDRWLIIGVVCSLIVIFIIGMSIGESKKENADILELHAKIDLLEERVEVFETLYKEHLEECSFISKNNIRVGHNNYLQKIN